MPTTKWIIFSLLYLLSILNFSECASLAKEQKECISNHSNLKYKVVKDGFIGKDLYARIDLCFKERRKDYEGLSRDCLITLIGKPMHETSSEMTYYFGRAKTGMITAGVHFTISSGKVIGSACFIV